MEGSQRFIEKIESTIGVIQCCICGTLIASNPSNMCINCLKSNCDITEGIPKQGSLYFCKGCERYLQSPGNWLYCQLESKELLTLCLKKIKNLNKVHLIDANFVWTEPHSKRIKIKLTVQKDVLGGALLQQIFTIEYVVHNQMCEACHRREAKDFWRALVQVRQKVKHKKTFFYLEQLLIKHRAHSNCTNIKAVNDGIDFCFDKKDDARKLVDFLQTVIPCRFIPSQQLISHDTHSNIYTYKHTFSVEIVPICKDDIVCLPSQLAASLGNIGPLCICLRVTNYIYLIDPRTLKYAELSNQNYWRHPFKALASYKKLTRYLVIDTEIVDKKLNPGSQKFQKHVFADAWIIKENDLGSKNSEIHTRTHLGHLLKPGDSVLAFDLRNANVNDENFEKYKTSHKDEVPDAIIVSKVFGEKNSRKRDRIWRLQRMAIDGFSQGDDDNDLQDFMLDLEEDKTMRQNVNIYLDKQKAEKMMSVDENEIQGHPFITIQEMLDDLDLND